MREPLHAVIHRVPGQAPAGMRDVLGRPLIGRQIEWLFRCGCDRVVVEVDASAESLAIVRWIGERHDLGRDVLLACAPQTHAKEALRVLAMRAGVTSTDALVAVPDDMLSDLHVRKLLPHANTYGVVAVLDAPEELRAGRHDVRHTLSGGTIRLVKAPMRRGPTTVHAPGWAVRLQSARDASIFARWMWQKSREASVSYRGCA